MANTWGLRAKTSLQALLKKLGIYHRLKQSFLYDLYWKYADSSLVRDRDTEVRFYREIFRGLKKGDLIFDVGANRGQKTDVFLRLGARVVAVEPDDTNQTILRESFLTFRLRKCPVTIVGMAAGAECRTESMWVDEPGSAKNTLSTKWVDTLRSDQNRFGKTLGFGHQKLVETTTLDHLISQFGRPYFIKIDVEGYEPTTLAGLTQTVPYLSFEVNLPEFLPEGIQCVEILNRLSAVGKFNYVTDCRSGLAFKEWLESREFLAAMSGCREPSIEVLWRSV